MGEQHQNVVKQQFGPRAKSYVDSPTHGNEAEIRRIVEKLECQPNWSVLDVATGGGHTAFAIAPYVEHVIASDLVVPMLEAASKRAETLGLQNVTFEEVDALTMPYEEGVFDVVTCRIAAHHFPDAASFVAESARVLRSGGRFLLVDNVAPEDDQASSFLQQFESFRDTSHVKCLKISEWKQILDACRLHVVWEETVIKTLDFEPWMRRMARDDQHVTDMQKLLLSAPDPIRKAFHMHLVDGAVERLGILEWRVICEK